MINQNQILVSVFDYKNKPISNAEVKLISRNESFNLPFDKKSGAYILLKFKPERYTISVSANNFEAQERSVFIGYSGVSEIFILGEKKMPFYYRNNVKVPFTPVTDRFGVVFKAPEEKNIEKIVSTIEQQYKVRLVKSDENYRKNGVYLFQYPDNLSEEEKQKLETSIGKLSGVSLVAPVLRQSDKNASLLTDEIIVRFKGEVEANEVSKIAREFNLKIIRTLPYAGNAYHFKVNKTTSFASLDICAKLMDRGIAEYAEPNLYHTYEEDAIIPNNFLFPEQWDHPLINTPDAWQALNDLPALGPTQKFGSPNIVVAVVDSGVNTAHQQFSGTVSNGQPKMFTSFDFVNMVANNNSLGGSHGTCCASASTGFTSTTSAGGVVPDGTVGVAGNCRLMGIRRGGTEADYSDMYIWVGGLNPNSARAGFPAVLARGADVITSSFGAGFTAPISGFMKDAFDYLTTYGRNGKGVIMTFSVGNYASNINFHLQRPWAAYPKTFACGASTLANDGVTEIISDYSGSGTLLDFCAPSHDAYVGSVPRHNPPQNYGAVTGTVLNGVSEDDGNMPRNRQLQTTTTANAAVGATSVTVASATGMATGQALFLGNPSANISASEAKRITNIVGNTITFTPALFAAKANGTIVLYGNRDYKSVFGGTSYSTPVCAGIAALMLSVNNRLTWMEVRELIRGTATKIDTGNTNATGRWLDVNGLNSTQAGYAGPFFSQFYGYGRVNAAAAVRAARDYTFERDIYVRDNMADAGATTAASPHWRGVDIWVRNINDGVVPASYATDANTVHLNPIFGQTNYLNIRYQNRGTQTSFPFYIRAYLGHYPGTEFIYPENFIPTVRPNGVIPNPLTPGTYLIGEQLVNPVNAAQDGSVLMEWQQGLIPPARVMVSGFEITWHPCLYAEVSPQDGFVPTGNHVWDNNNLAQKNISINYPGDSGDNASIVMIGKSFENKLKNLKYVISWESKIKQSFFLHFADQKINQIFLEFAKEDPATYKIERYKKAMVAWVISKTKISFTLPNTGLIPLIIGLGKGEVKQDVSINVLQYDGRIVSGSFGIEFKSRKP